MAIDYSKRKGTHRSGAAGKAAESAYRARHARGVSLAKSASVTSR